MGVHILEPEIFKFYFLNFHISEAWLYTVGWVIWLAKTVPEMTNNVFSGTLNPTHSLTHAWLYILLKLV